MAFEDWIKAAMEGRGAMTRSQVRTHLGVKKGTFDQRFTQLVEEGRIVRAGTTPQGATLWRWGNSAIDQFLARPPVRKAV